MAKDVHPVVTTGVLLPVKSRRLTTALRWPLLCRGSRDRQGGVLPIRPPTAVGRNRTGLRARMLSRWGRTSWISLAVAVHASKTVAAGPGVTGGVTPPRHMASGQDPGDTKNLRTQLRQPRMARRDLRRPAACFGIVRPGFESRTPTIFLNSTQAPPRVLDLD